MHIIPVIWINIRLSILVANNVNMVVVLNCILVVFNLREIEVQVIVRSGISVPLNTRIDFESVDSCSLIVLVLVNVYLIINLVKVIDMYGSFRL